MERSDLPYDEPPAEEQTTFEEQGFEEWSAWNPCADGGPPCKRCYIDYTTYLAYKALRDLNDASKE